jgi:HEAT repeat protein
MILFLSVALALYTNQTWAVATKAAPSEAKTERGERQSTALQDSKLRDFVVSELRKKTPQKEIWLKAHDKFGKATVPTLLDIVANDNERDDLRWACLFGIARLTGKKSYDVLQKYAQHKSWLLRDASLRAMAALNARDLKGPILDALNDDALVVRTTAVDVIGHLKMTNALPALIAVLEDPKNFRKNHPLWIHDHVLDVIKGWKSTTAVPALVEVLEKNKNPAFRTKVVAALEALTNKRFQGKTADEQVYLWRRHAMDYKSL